ncbi:MAG: hypothetical protein Fur0037_21420 [Planctomycetota bacterium]
MARHAAPSILSPLLPLLLAPACSVFSSGPSGHATVEELLRTVQAVQSEAEATHAKAQAAVVALRRLTASDFAGDPVTALAELDQAVKESEQATARLFASLEPMKDAAGPVFAQWAKDVNSMASETLRAKSQQRLDATRQRFDAILMNLEPAIVACQELDNVLRDSVLFLSHDLNQDALRTLGEEMPSITSAASRLERKFRDSSDAASAYIAATALPDASGTPAAPAVEVR